jgi:peroxiredoxin
MADQINSAAEDFEAIACLSVPLAQKLEAYYSAMEVRRPQFSKAYENMVERLIAADTGADALKVGDQLPDFLLPDDDGKLIMSQDLLAQGPLVISFNRGHWCSFCRLELLALNEHYDDFKKRGSEIISITPQKAHYMKTLRQNLGIRFPFLTDMDNGYALTTGLMISIDSTLSQAYAEVGINLTEFQGNDGYFLPIPATYVVASDGKVTAAFVEPDFRKRMSLEDIIKAIDKLVAG